MEEFNNQLFVVNKAAGPTSFDVVAAFRRAASLRKVGHTGTLDPLAQGVLLLCTGVATRAVEHFMNLEKEYQFDIRLGAETDTLDAEGEVVREAPCPDFDDDRIHEVAGSFVGDYDLQPPVYSALKKNGRRLYEMARAGETPEIDKRTVQIYDFQVVSVDLPSVTCRIRCSRGTYVRSLAKDFGDKLDVPAHIDNIVRTRIGPFSSSDGFPSDKLFDKDLTGLSGYPLSRALDFLPAVVLADKARKALRYGMIPVTRDVVKTIGEVKAAGPVRILDNDGALIAVGQRNSGKRRHPLQLVDTFRLYIDNTRKKGERTAN
jgi:tRNA pseudouridine55 synthase